MKMSSGKYAQMMSKEIRNLVIRNSFLEYEYFFFFSVFNHL